MFNRSNDTTIQSTIITHLHLEHPSLLTELSLLTEDAPSPETIARSLRISKALPLLITTCQLLDGGWKMMDEVTFVPHYYTVNIRWVIMRC